jgi:hypothetical protein
MDGVPIAERRDELKCGVVAVDLRSGRLLGMLEFQTAVEEIFDVQILPGTRSSKSSAFSKTPSATLSSCRHSDPPTTCGGFIALEFCPAVLAPRCPQWCRAVPSGARFDAIQAAAHTYKTIAVCTNLPLFALICTGQYEKQDLNLRGLPHWILWRGVSSRRSQGTNREERASFARCAWRWHDVPPAVSEQRIAASGQSRRLGTRCVLEHVLSARLSVMATTLNSLRLFSLSHIARHLQVMPAKIRQAAQELRIVPSLTVDERAYFAESDVDRIARHLADRR